MGGITTLTITMLAAALQVVISLFAAFGLASAFQSHDAGQRWIPSGDDRGAVIFLHGLGDTANGWASLDHMLPSICPRLSTEKIEYIFPQAPVKGVTLNGGELLPAWFDLFDFPIDSTSRDDVIGQLNAVCLLEETVKSVERERGIPASRIVVGGFAQGGSVAMLASYFRKERKQ
jgi:predicted esterase